MLLLFGGVLSWVRFEFEVESKLIIALSGETLELVEVSQNNGLSLVFKLKLGTHELNWTQTETYKIVKFLFPFLSSFAGPSEDHNGDPTGYFIYTEVSGRTRGDKTRLITTPRFQGLFGPSLLPADISQ